jgi:hypothetical protein
MVALVIRLAPLLLLLAACSDRDVIQMTPTLTCPHAIDCDVYEWQIGVRYGPKISGTHINCKCQE